MAQCHKLSRKLKTKTEKFFTYFSWISVLVSSQVTSKRFISLSTSGAKTTSFWAICLALSFSQHSSCSWEFNSSSNWLKTLNLQIKMLFYHQFTKGSELVFPFHKACILVARKAFNRAIHVSQWIKMFLKLTLHTSDCTLKTF